MKTTVALIALGVAGVGAGLYFLSRKGASGAGTGLSGLFSSLTGGGAVPGASGMIEDVNVSAGVAIPAGSSPSFSQKAANVFANKTGTDLICKGVSTYYTGGAANGACGTVAAIANKVTQVQIAATVAVAKKVGSAAAPVASFVKSSVVVPTKAAITVTKAAVTAPVKAVSKVANVVGGWF